MSKTKRGLDLGLSLVGLLVTWPLVLFIAVMVKAEDGGPVFFRQERVGKGGRPFRMWKFRTMVPTPERADLQLTIVGDSRITRTGTWLRRKKLDELPQLFNVVVGDMTMVGPRPEVPKYVEMYTPEQRKVLELKPGITDVASIAFADESDMLAKVTDPERFYVERIVPEKIRLNLEYANGATPWSDLGIVLETITRVVPRTRARHSQTAAVGSDPLSTLGA